MIINNKYIGQVCKLLLLLVVVALMSTTCVADTQQEDKSAGYAMRQLTAKVDKETKAMNKKIQALKKYNSKTKKIVCTYKNKKNKSLRKKTLSKIAVSNKYKNNATKNLSKAKKLASEGAPISASIKNAKTDYTKAYKASRSARKLANRAKKRFLKTQTRSLYWKGPALTKFRGVNNGPTGVETYYNLNMNGCIRMMRQRGYSKKKYPYWIRDDGCKMLGNYIMCGAYLKKYPKGTKVECSLGTCIVVDTGYMRNKNHLDIAVNW